MNHPPVIASSSFSVPRYSRSGSVIGSVNAYDVDTNQTLSFFISGLFFCYDSLLGGNALTVNDTPIVDLFHIDSTSGQLSLLNDAVFLLDVDRILLQVTVFDDGIPPRNASFSLPLLFYSLVLPFPFD